MNKSIWQPMSFTLILPGLGHILIGKYKTGITAICLLVFLKTFAVYTVLSDDFLVYLNLLIKILCSYIFPLFFCLLLFFPKKNLKNQTAGKDLWLSAFLTLIFPGLGHLYLKKISPFLFISILYLIIYFFMETGAFSSIVLLLIYIAALLSIFSSHKISKRNLQYFMVFFICFSTYTELIWPYFYNTYTLIYTELTGASCSPTINEGDTLIGNKLAYIFEEPQIGDFVLIDLSQNKNYKYVKECIVKRIVAKGGDIISYDFKNFYLNGKIIDTGYTRAYNDSWGKNKKKKLNPRVRNFNIFLKEYIVPQDHFFVLGDNLFDSEDSKCFGPIPKDYIVGKINKIILPPDRIRLLTDKNENSED